MKLLFVINALTIGGAQILLVDLVESALKKGFKVDVVAFRNGPISEKLFELGVKPHILGELFLDLIPFYRLVAIINSLKPDVIHTHLFRATILTRLAKMMTGSCAKVITTVHGLETEAYHRLEGLTCFLSDYFVFPSSYLSEWYSSSISKLKESCYKVLYPGVIIKPVLEKTSSNATVVIGTLSRLHHVKGLDVLISAVKILKKNCKSFEILIGGGGKGKDVLERLVYTQNISDICKFVDNVSEKSNYLENLDIFVSPSRKEAFGINLCEAMERSLPVVASKVGGIPEVVEDKRSGLLFDAENAEKLAEKLEILIKDLDLRRRMGQNGRERVEQLFNRNKALEEHMKLYEEITRERRVHFAVSSRELGGGERLALDLMLSLRNRGWTVTATCAGNPLYKTLIENGFDCSVASMWLGGVFFAIKLAEDLKRFKPSVISSHLNKASLFAGLLSRITLIPCISHIHGLNKKIYYQFSKRQVAVSGGVKKHIEKQGLTGESLVAINNCINKPAVGHRNFPERPLNIAVTAKLHANKGHEWALKAINSHIGRLNIGHIHIFGDGPERKNLERLCESLSGIKKKIVFHGFVNKVDDYYSEIDLALLPSLGEGIPLSLLEVMRLGIPVVSTDVGGVPEIIVNGESGILVEPGDSEAIVSAIGRMMEKEGYEKFSIGAYNRFKEINNHEKMVDDFEKLLLTSFK